MGLFWKEQTSQDQTRLSSPSAPACPPGLDRPGQTHNQPSIHPEGSLVGVEDPQTSKDINACHLQVGVNVGQSSDEGDLTESMHLAVSLARSLSRQEEQRQSSLSQAEDTAKSTPETKTPMLLVPVAAALDPEASDDPSMKHDLTLGDGETSDSAAQHEQPIEACSSEQELSKLIQESLLCERLLDIELPADFPPHEEEESSMNLEAKEAEAGEKKSIIEPRSICVTPTVTLNTPDGLLDAGTIPAPINVGEGKSVSYESSREIQMQTSSLVHDQSSQPISTRSPQSEERPITSLHAAPVSSVNPRLQTLSLAAPNVESEPRIRKLSFKNMFGPLKRKD